MQPEDADQGAIESPTVELGAGRKTEPLPILVLPDGEQLAMQAARKKLTAEQQRLALIKARLAVLARGGAHGLR